MNPERAISSPIDSKPPILTRPETIIDRLLQAPSPFKELEKIFPEINTHYPYDELVQLKKEGDTLSLVVACLPTLFHSIRCYTGLGLTPDELFEIGLEDALKTINSWNPDSEQPEKLSKKEEPIQQKKGTSDYLRFKISRRLDYRFRSEIIQRHGMKNEHDGYALIKFYHDSFRRFKEEFGRLPSQNEIIAFMEERIIRGEAVGIMGDTKIGKFFSDKEIVAQISNFYRERNRFPTTQELGLDVNGFVLSFRKKVQIIDKSLVIANLKDHSEDGDLERMAIIDEMRETIKKLQPLGQQIIALRFGLNDNGEFMTLEKIARLLGISRMQAYRIKIRALIKLRAFLRGE